MITHIIQGANSQSQIVLGESLTQLHNYIVPRKCIIVTDELVYQHYHEMFPVVKDVMVIGTGEGVKTLDTVHAMYQRFFEAELDRSALIVAIGGGIVCDITGFAASTFLRGLQFGFVPTTLLAQVDASVGGKNAVNFQGYKNMIGTFTQPEFVLINVAVLKTLAPRTLGCGLAEAIKHGAIADESLFTFMEDQVDRIRDLVPESIERIINDSIIIKSAIVNKDEKEHGERRKLNFGHTFGHAVEKTLGLPHGESVSIGMVVAAKLSQQRGYLSQDDVNRLVKLLRAYDLPVHIDADMTSIKEAIRKDKKRYGETIKFILLQELGNAIIQDVSLQELYTAIEP